jgi:hypothetical protein
MRSCSLLSGLISCWRKPIYRGLQHPLAGSPVPSSTSSLAARQQIRPDVSNSGWDARHTIGRAPDQ